MKFLTKEDWESILNRLSLNNKNNSKESRVEKMFYEISQRIKRMLFNGQKQRLDFITYGIAMTFFHYYVCFNDIKNMDRIQVCFACLYMSYKIQFINYPLSILKKNYKDYLENEKIQGTDKKTEVDFIKYEIQLYSQLGYDLEIETPFNFFYNGIYSQFPFSNSKEGLEKLEKLKCFCFNLINDTYTRPLSIYFHPKIIYLSCLIFSIKFLEYNEIDINKLILNENVDLIAECMENIYQIYSRFIEDSPNKNNNIINKDNK